MPSRCFLLGILFLSSAASLSAQSIRNWSAPPGWSPPRSGFGAKVVQGDISNLLPFVAINPCRMLDTRITGGAIVSGTTRNVVLTGAPCGIPTVARAVSANFAVFEITGTTQNGVLLVYPTGSPSSSQAMVNWAPTSGQLDNASVVPLGSGGAITVQPNQGAGTINLVIDVNGYYSETAALLSDPFQVINASHYAISGQVFGSGVNDAGVFGFASSLTGVTDGVWGQSDSSSDFAAGVLATQTGTSGITFGVFGRSSSTSSGSTGVYGEAVGANGDTFGVYGFAASQGAGSAGVRGIGGFGSPPQAGLHGSAGVRGENVNGTGVLGISEQNGVTGMHVDSSGNIISFGTLGEAGSGVFYFGGLIGSGPKSFVEPHPSDPSKAIRYVSLEGPEAGTYFRGTDETHHGVAVISVPESFRLVTDTEGLTVQLTPIGAPATLYVVSQNLDQIEVRSSRDVKFAFMVNGVRKAYPHWAAIQDNEKFFVPESPSDRLPRYLSEEETGRLIRNGTYNPDGTVNMETAERLGWTKKWAEREARVKIVAEEARRSAAAK